MTGETLKCGKCGNDQFTKRGEDHPQKAVIYTCTECGNEIWQYKGEIVDCCTQERRKIENNLLAIPVKWTLELGKKDGE